MTSFESKSIKKAKELIREYADLKEQMDELKTRVDESRDKVITQMVEMDRSHFSIDDGGTVIKADLIPKEYANCFDVPGFYDALSNGDKRNFKHVVKVCMSKALKLIKACPELKGEFWDVEIRPTLTVKRKIAL